MYEINGCPKCTAPSVRFDKVEWTNVEEFRNSYDYPDWSNVICKWRWGWVLGEDDDYVSGEAVEIHFCPFCGECLPEPEQMRLIQELGY